MKSKSAKAATPEVPADPVRPTKSNTIRLLLARPEGASIEDLMVETGWQAHSVRGFLAGTIKAKLGLSLTSTVEGNTRIYRTVLEEPA